MNKGIGQIAGQVLLTLSVAVFATSAMAGNYDFEVGLSFGTSDTDTSSPIGFAGQETFGLATTSSDSDRVKLSGAWYYSGLSDNSGPKSRAAFLDRASGVHLAYSYEDSSGSFANSGVENPPVPFPIPPSTGSTDSTSHSLEAGLRHVWKASGWYALAGASRVDSDFDGVFAGISGSYNIDATAYTLGVGKYLGQGTAVDLSIVSSDLDGYDTTAYALSLNHVGQLGDKWHYAADLGIAESDRDNSDNTYLLGLALFPSTELEFGIGVVRQDGPFDGDRDSYEGFVNWFVRDHIQVNASYETIDWEPNSFTDFDSDQFTIGVNVRF